MNIALIGYGKMGKEVETMAHSMGHVIVLKINNEKALDLTSENLRKADVAIEFTRPEIAFSNISKCLNVGIPIVVGTTGWYKSLDQIKQLCGLKKGSLLYSANFSIGVNLFFELNQRLSKLMSLHNEYVISIEEIHHTQKLDSPSGTAIALLNDIIKNSNPKNFLLDDTDHKKIDINSIRKEGVVGIHSVMYKSPIDKIEITHEAFSRKGFAQGAILAAQWLIGKQGIYTMQDFLNIK